MKVGLVITVWSRARALLFKCKLGSGDAINSEFPESGHDQIVSMTSRETAERG